MNPDLIPAVLSGVAGVVWTVLWRWECRREWPHREPLFRITALGTAIVFSGISVALFVRVFSG